MPPISSQSGCVSVARETQAGAGVAYNWTAEGRVERLKALHAEGLSCTVIARRLHAEFGEPLTRCSVIGKVSRLQLNPPPLRGRKTVSKRQNTARLKRMAPSTRKAMRPKSSLIRDALSSIPAEPIPQARPDDIARVSFLELETHHCRFIPHDPQEGDALTAKKFCGLDAIPGTPYCKGHLPRCYVIYSPRRSPVTDPSAPGKIQVGGDGEKVGVG